MAKSAWWEVPKAAAVADQRERAAVPTVAVVFRMSIVVLFTGLAPGWRLDTEMRPGAPGQGTTRPRTLSNDLSPIDFLH